MNKNIIDFYLEANKLKSTIRTGWKEVGVSSDKIESVADHVYGSIVLSLGLVSEKDYSDLDLMKVFKMLIVRELSKVNMEELSVLSKEDRKKANREAVLGVVGNLKMGDEFMSLYDEAEKLETKEAKFVLYVTKLESDIQAKKYELDGEFTLENAKADIENYPEDMKNEILPQVQNASDGWILFDRKYYEGNEVFEELSRDIQNLK